MRAAKMRVGIYQGKTAKSAAVRVGRATGGRVNAKEEMTADGEKSTPRLDRAPRGKPAAKSDKGKGHTNVNVIVAPKSDTPKAPMPMPMMGGAGAPPMPPMPPRPPMMPPGGPMPPPGMPMRSRGGRVTKNDDEAADRKLIKSMIAKEEKREGRASGGRVHMTGGAEGGRGRLEKIKLQKAAK